VHSKLQIMASAELAGRGFPQFSQVGRISNIGRSYLLDDSARGVSPWSRAGTGLFASRNYCSRNGVGV
jgi:hypothetical protein